MMKVKLCFLLEKNKFCFCYSFGEVNTLINEAGFFSRTYFLNALTTTAQCVFFGLPHLAGNIFQYQSKFP